MAASHDTQDPRGNTGPRRRRRRSLRLSVTDGPFAETKELIAWGADAPFVALFPPPIESTPTPTDA